MKIPAGTQSGKLFRMKGKGVKDVQGYEQGDQHVRVVVETPTHLTPRQKEIYDFIRDKIESRGYGPTVREIGLAFKIQSPNGVMCHLKALEKKGLTP